MRQTPYISDREMALDAARLAEILGAGAGAVAAANAARCRNQGNVVNFCRWRQVERLIAVLYDGEDQTRH